MGIIYAVSKFNSGVEWRLTICGEYIDDYKSMKGAKIAAKKLGYNYKVVSGYGN